MKACPNCGSTNITLRIPQTDLWICKDCGWEGTVIVEFPDESLKKMKGIKVEEGNSFQEKIKKLEKEMGEE